MKYSKEKVKEICDLIESGNTHKDAAIIAGISEALFYKWKNERLEFFESLKKAEARCVAAHVMNVRRHALGLDGTQVRWTASAWWLERTQPERFALKWQGELSGRGGKPLIPEGAIGPTVDWTKFTDEELKRMVMVKSVTVAEPTNGHANGNGNGNGNGHTDTTATP